MLRPKKGFFVAKREYNNETKAAVLAALMEGQSINAVAKAYKIPKGTVSSWQKREGEKLDEVRHDAASQLSGGQAKTEIGGLFATYLTTSLMSLIGMAKVMGDQAYLKTQGIEGIAMGFGVMTDKVVRVVEAMNRDKSESDTAEN